MMKNYDFAKKKSDFPTFMVLMVCCVSCECWEVTAASTGPGDQPGLWTGQCFLKLL